MKTIFLTGASGFLGRYLVREFRAAGHEVLALIRRESRKKVAGNEAYAGVNWIEGDLETLAETLTPEDRTRLANVTDIVHAAALYDLALPEAALYGANVLGTHEMIRLANTLPKLKTFHYISTLAVAGTPDKKAAEVEFTEGQFEKGQTLPDGYSLTKFAAEGALRHSDGDYTKKIYRLGILVGDSETGYMPKVDGLYYVLRFLMQHERIVRGVLGRIHHLPFPYSDEARTYLIPVDVTAKAIAAAFESPLEKGESLKTYHIVGEGQLVRDVLGSMLNFLGLELKLLPLPKSKLNDRVVEQVGVPKEALNYLYEAPIIANKRFAAEFPTLAAPKFEDYAPTLYRYARENLKGDGGTT